MPVTFISLVYTSRLLRTFWLIGSVTPRLSAGAHQGRCRNSKERRGRSRSKDSVEPKTRHMQLYVRQNGSVTAPNCASGIGRIMSPLNCGKPRYVTSNYSCPIGSFTVKSCRTRGEIRPSFRARFSCKPGPVDCPNVVKRHRRHTIHASLTAVRSMWRRRTRRVRDRPRTDFGTLDGEEERLDEAVDRSIR